MKILDLVNKEKSEVEYKISKFPDGQQQVSIVPDSVSKAEWLYTTSEGVKKAGKLIKQAITIKSRLNNFMDLEVISCTVASLRELGIKEIHLYTPYIVGARSDRKFEEGSNNYLKRVICPIINSLEFNSVTCLDPHSDVLEACINNYIKVSNFEFVNYTLSHLYGNKDKPNECILLSPDAGAYKKVYELARALEFEGEILTCGKSRDLTTGKILGVDIPLKEEHKNKHFIIIDDICDGAASFIGIAKAIKEFDKNSKITLVVTHGIFSRGFKELSDYFDKIYCTNSYKDIPSQLCIDIPGTEGYVLNDFVNQIDVF